MSVLYVMVPIAFLLAGVGIWAFIRAAKAGQFDDLETPAVRMLLDDPPDAPPAPPPIGPHGAGNHSPQSGQPGANPGRSQV